MAAPLKPLERTALLTTYGATGKSLQRTRGGFVSARKPAQIFTRRVMNWLYRRALIDFDDPLHPKVAMLTRMGLAQAEALINQAREQAGAP